MNAKEALQQFGLDEKEATIYLANLEVGLSSAKEIAQKANIQRTYFYDISEKLIQVGIIKQFKKGKKRMFLAVEPEKIIEMQEEKSQQLRDSLPQLKAIQNTSGEKPKVYFYEGRSGIDQVNEDTLKYRGEITAFTTPKFISADEEKLSQEYIQKRISLKIKARVIGEISDEILKIKQKDASELRETRMLPKNLFSSQVELGIYGSKSYFINYKNEFGLIIEDTEISKTLKNIFELVWDSGRILDK